MMLEEYKKRKKGRKFLKFIGIIVAIVVTVASLHACGVRFLKSKVDDLKNLSNDFKENAKEFAPSKEETKEITKNGIEKLFDFIMKGSEFVDENITQPAFELSNELAEEQNQKFQEKRDKENKGDDSSSSEALIHVAFWYTIDGDTIQVLTDNSEFITVRLIGINTPESVAKEEYLEKKGTVNSDYGKMASNWVNDYIEKTIITNHSDLWLQYDKETKDQYGRTLAYVWISDEVDVEYESDVLDYMLNAQIVKYGYAEDVVYEPNHKYAHIFKKLREEAEQSKIGLWQFEDIGDFY
ncbi:MAG: thermonuclease family protein [Lachnospiraceae bacterium]|nr:thermonuclease family protein [Lachnospiraceae bacterium]